VWVAALRGSVRVGYQGCCDMDATLLCEGVVPPLLAGGSTRYSRAGVFPCRWQLCLRFGQALTLRQSPILEESEM